MASAACRDAQEAGPPWVRYFNQDSDFTPAVDYIEDLDDAYDLLDHVVFFVRLVEKGNRDGEWPWPSKM